MSKQLAFALSFVAVLFFAWMIREVAGPVLVGGLFAILLTPLNDWLKTKLGKRAHWASAFVTTASLLVVLVPSGLILMFTIRSLMAVKGLTKMLDSILATVQKVGAPLRPFGFDLSDEGLKESLQTAAEKLVALAGTIAASTPALAIGAVVFMLSLFFWLRDGRRFLDWLRQVLPFTAAQMDRLFESVRIAVRGVMVAQLATGLVQAGLTMGALFALSVPGAFLWGVLAFILSFIPLVGTAPVTLGATVFLFANGSIVKGIIMGVCGLVIGVSDNLVRPWAASEGGGMHPLLSTVAIFGGLAALGTTGVFVGPVVAAIAVWSLEFFAVMKED